MLTKIRIRLATLLIWAGANIGPPEMRQIILHMLEAWSGIPDQKHQGRTGGLITAGWWISIEGENLARAQELAARNAAYSVREFMEKRQ